MAEQTRFWSMIRRRGWLIAFISIGVFCVSILIAFEMTPIYRSEGRILVQEGDIPSDLVNTTVRGFVEERIELVRKRVFSDEHITDLIEANALYEAEPALLSKNEQIRKFKDSSTVLVEELADGTISFVVSFDNTDPVKARDVADALVNLFLVENVASRTRSASEAAQFLENESARLAVRIADYEKQIATYKEENEGGLPEQQNLNAQMLERAERELDAVSADIRGLEQRRAMTEADIVRLRTAVSTYSGDIPAVGSADRLRYLQAEYLRMLAIYSPEHPDLVRLKREIEVLSPGASSFSKQFIADQIRVEEAKLVELRGRYSDDHPDVIAMQKLIADLRVEFQSAPSINSAAAELQDPEVMRLMTERAGIDKELAAQRARQNELRQDISAYERRLTATPRVELELLELTRGYEQLREKYDDIKLKQTQVELAVSAEQEQRAERFGVVASPRLATSPAIPNRPAVILLGFLFGIGLALLVVTAMESTDKTIRDQYDLREIWGAPALVSIPKIRNRVDNRHRLYTSSLYMLSILVLIISATISVAGA